jgi:hypothetical protein
VEDWIDPAWGEDVWTIGEVEPFFERLQRPPAPIVRLRGFPVGVPGHGGEITSADRPSMWTAVPCGKLSVVVQFDIAFTREERWGLGYVELLLDGEVVNNGKYLVGRDQVMLSEEGPIRLTYTYELPCVAPGKHLLQARYVTDGVWSRISSPLRFQVKPRRQPEIVGVADGCEPLGPGDHIRLSNTCTGKVRMWLAHVEPKDQVFLYLDGRYVGCRESCSCTPRKEGQQQDAQEKRHDGQRPVDAARCSVEFDIAAHVIPGVHRLQVRAGGCERCALASKLSEPVMIHYYNNSPDTYTLMKNGGPFGENDWSGCCPHLLPSGFPPPMIPQGGAAPEPEEVYQLPPPSKGPEPTKNSSGSVLRDARFRPARFVLADEFPALDSSASETETVVDSTAEVPGTGSTAGAGDNTGGGSPRDGAKPAEIPDPSAEGGGQLPAPAQTAGNGEPNPEKATPRERPIKDAPTSGNVILSRARDLVGTVEEILRCTRNATGQLASCLSRDPSEEVKQDVHDREKADKEEKQPPLFPKTFYFLAPAHFPYRGFGPQGEVFDRRGLLIHEGMWITYDMNGDYTVRFEYTEVEMPVTVQLQLQVHVKLCNGDSRWHTLTLVPQRIVPHEREKVLAECCRAVPSVCKISGKSIILKEFYTGIDEFRRTGTARFGYGETGLSYKRKDSTVRQVSRDTTASGSGSQHRASARP